MSIADPTEDDLAVAKALRAAIPPWSWGRIACHLAVSQYRLRCELEPGYYVRQLTGVRRNREKRRLNEEKQPRAPRGPVCRTIELSPGQAPSRTGGPQTEIPYEVLADRDRRLVQMWRDTTAILMGDPPIGRSALDQRK